MRSWWSSLTTETLRLLRRRDVAVSIANVAIVGALCYIDSDVRYAMAGDTGIYSTVYKRGELTHTARQSAVPDSVLLVDVAFDQQLVAAVNSFGDTIGTTAITDRRKLVEFLTLAKRAGNYSKLMVDIRFEHGLRTPYDRQLTQLLLSMPRVYFPRHRGVSLLSPKLEARANYSDYGYTLFQTSFVKYEYVQKGEPSIPLAMTGYGASQLGPLHFVNHRLAYNSMMIPMLVNPGSVGNNADEPWCVNLGSDLLAEPSLVGDMLRNRVVVVGNMHDDIHQTYVGNIPGSLINLNAYLAMERGLNLVDWRLCLLWAFIYFVLSMLTIKGRQWYSYIPRLRRVKSDIFWFALSFVGYSIVVTIVASVLFLTTGYMSNVVLPSLYFSLFSVIVKFKTNRYEKIS